MSTPSAEGRVAGRRAELRAFLRSRRARLSPADVGLPDGGGRRRTPGLRREEVAVLAGVGVSWYQWLEQGRDISVSPQVLDAVARVLRLTNAERRHLYRLSGLNPPAAEVGEDAEAVAAGLRRLIDAWLPGPAHVMDRYWNCIMYNDAAAEVLGMGPGVARNCLIAYFTDPVYRRMAVNWEENARAIAAQFRMACSENSHDEGFAAIATEARRLSPEFAAIWEQRDVTSAGVLTKVIEHPVVGALHMESTQLQVPSRPDLTVVLHTPDPATDTAAKLEHLGRMRLRVA